MVAREISNFEVTVRTCYPAQIQFIAGMEKKSLACLISRKSEEAFSSPATIQKVKGGYKIDTAKIQWNNWA